MPDERPIEKLLRRYAKKRCGEVGSPVELHPATRRLLQGEVASQFKIQNSKFKRPGLRGERRRFFNFEFLTHNFPRLAWAVPLFVLIAIGLWSLHDQPETKQLALGLTPKQTAATASESQVSSPKPKAADSVADVRLQTSDSELSPAAVPVRTLNQPAPILANNGLADEERRKERTLAYGTTTNQPATSLGSAVEQKRDSARYGFNELARTDKSGIVSAATPAPGLSTEAASTNLQFTNSSARSFAAKVSESVAPLLDTLSPSASLARSDNLEREPAQTYSQSFANLAPESLKQKTAKAIAPAPISPVLANFRVEQTGRQLRVVDGDGSTYLGETDSTPLGETGGGGKKEQVAQLFKSDGKLSQLPAAAATSSLQPQAQNNFYRVVGTNRTLNQSVVFTWSYLEMTNAPVVAQSGRIRADLNKDAQKLPTQFPALLQNSFINGRAQFETGKEIEINAVPVPP